MLAYHAGAAERMAEVTRDFERGEGPAIPAAVRASRHTRVAEPPQRERAARWRTDMSPSDRATFEGIAGEQLMKLGYEVSEAHGERRRARHRELGLTDSEYDRIRELLGREPNDLELAMFSLMWSEHCAYKHSRKLLRRFPTEGERVGPGENAGAVDVGGGRVAAFKVESHNHPSAVEPFQGAATGSAGSCATCSRSAPARSRCSTLRFGELDSERSRYLFDRVVAGIGHYGNSIGVPTVGGEVYFEPPTSTTAWSTRCASGSRKPIAWFAPPPPGPGTPW